MKRVLLICSLLLTNTAYCQTDNFKGEWVFAGAEIKEYTIDSRKNINREISVSSIKDSLPPKLQLIPTEITIGNPLSFVETKDKNLITGDAEFSGKTIGKDFNLGSIADFITITIYVVDKGKNNNGSEQIPYTFIIYVLQDHALQLNNTFYGNNDKGFTMLYEIKCNYKKKNKSPNT